MLRVFLVNPWATDFSAFDLWARPLGLLYLAGALRHLGCEPILLDCMDRHHESLAQRPWRPRAFSCGKYPAHEIPKPDALKWLPRKFKRYGISTEAFHQALDKAGQPDLILVGSRMTHWYPGVVEAIRILRERFPDVRIVLGGVYPTLFPEHAEAHSGTDHVVQGEGENVVVQLVAALRQRSSPALPFDLNNLDELPAPAYDLLSAHDCLPFLTSRGCPRRCSYCASSRLFERFRRRDPVRAADHLIECVERFGFCDVAFYDDALLADAERHFDPFCNRLLDWRCGFRGNLRFHTPNGLDYALLNDAIAKRLADLGFETIRLSLETANRERLRQLGREPELTRFEAALGSLARAGFDLRRIGVYVLFGLPGQTRAEVERSVDYVFSLGAMPRLAEFSPLPLTGEWEKVRHLGDPPLETEPLLTNNSVFYRLDDEFPDSWLNALRHRIHEAQETNSSGSPRSQSTATSSEE